MFIAITVILLAVATFSADGCSCHGERNKTYADWVCRHDMVIRAFVQGKNESTTQQPSGYTEPRTTVDPRREEHSIEIRTIAVFKNANNGATPTAIRTPGTGSMCGQEFSENEEYLILGSSRGSEIYTIICNWNKVWKLLDNEAIQGLESGKFVKACKNGNY